jgi:hypothetical protein
MNLDGGANSNFDVLLYLEAAAAFIRSRSRHKI